MEGEMRFKTILAGVSGGSASNGALELACRFAERFGAHLEAFHARLDPRDLFTYAGDGFGAMSGEFIDRFVEDADATAKVKITWSEQDVGGGKLVVEVT